MIIAAYAIGARYGYIYCRAEYPLAIRRLQIALEQARQLGLLGSIFWAVTSVLTCISRKVLVHLCAARRRR